MSVQKTREQNPIVPILHLKVITNVSKESLKKSPSFLCSFFEHHIHKADILQVIFRGLCNYPLNKKTDQMR